MEKGALWNEKGKPDSNRVNDTIAVHRPRMFGKMHLPRLLMSSREVALRGHLP